VRPSNKRCVRPLMVSQIDDSDRNCDNQNCHRAGKCESYARQSEKAGEPLTRTRSRSRLDRAVLYAGSRYDRTPHRLRNLQLAIVARVDFLLGSQRLRLLRTIAARYPVGADLLRGTLLRLAS